MSANECHRRRSSHHPRCARRRRTAWPAASVVRRCSPTRTTKQFVPDKSFSFLVHGRDGCDRSCISRACDAQPTTVMCDAYVWSWSASGYPKFSCMALLRQFSCSGKKIEAIDFDEYFNNCGYYESLRDVCYSETCIPLKVGLRLT